MVEWKQGTVNEDGYYDYDYRYYHEPGYYQDDDDDDDDDNDDDDDDDEGDDDNDYYDDNDDDDDDDDDDDTLYIERFADFNDMDETIHAIITDDNVCNGKSGYEFVLERYHALEFLSVGNNCFNKTVRFSLSYLPSLPHQHRRGLLQLQPLRWWQHHSIVHDHLMQRSGIRLHQ